MIQMIVFLTWMACVAGFQGIKQGAQSAEPFLVKMTSERNNWVFPNPFKEVADMFSNWDDVIDDFMFKRMGNGEVFYGKRKYKPSNRPNTDGKYKGMGMTDKMRIDIAREIKEERMERRNQQDNKPK
jgi:hypothetical protein